MKKYLIIRLAVLVILMAVVPSLLAKNKDKEKGEKNPAVAPTVLITSPEDETIVAEDTLDVVVSFGPKEHGKGNVKYIMYSG